jgi:hypothetical protein
MTIRFDEKPTSRATTYDPPSCTLLYTFAGSTDHAIAWSYAYSLSPTMYLAAGQTLYRQDVRVSCAGYDVWDVEVPYGKLDRTVGSYRFAFSTTGGTVNIKQAKAHVAVFPAGKPDNKGAIDVEGDTVHGAEIVIPALKLTYTFKHPLGFVNEAVAVRLSRLTGRTNSATWHGFKAGECLFLGAEGGDGSDSEAEVSYQVAASEEMTNATVGAITGVNKKGWDISWNSFEPVAAGGKPTRTVEYISVERVYDSFAFATELGF